MNKNGWGLRAELGFLLLFLICLLVATIGLHKMGIFGVGNTNINVNENGSFDYGNLENKVTIACKKYYSSNYPNGSSDTIIMNLTTLKNTGYLSPIYDSLNRECKG